MVFGSRIRDPGSGKNPFRIPDHGSRGQKGTGSRIRIRNTVSDNSEFNYWNSSLRNHQTTGPASFRVAGYSQAVLLICDPGTWIRDG